MKTRNVILRVGIMCLFFLSLGSVLYGDNSFPDIGGRMVFISERDGSPGIWVTDMNTGDAKKIFSPPEGMIYIMQPRWSMDGKTIAFSGHEICWNIYTIKTDGTDLQQITFYDGSTASGVPIWSPKGENTIYYLKGWPRYKALVHKVDLDSGEDIEYPNSSGMSTQTFDISSDETEILFMREPSCCWTPTIYTGYQDLTGAVERIIKPTDGNAEWMPRINRKDGWIVYFEASAYHPPYTIYKMDPDGNNVTQLTLPDLYDYPIWLDGDNNGYIALVGPSENGREILIMKADSVLSSQNMRGLSESPVNDRDPDWTPTGFNIAPEANAGPDQALELSSCEGAEVTLDGSMSADPDNNIVSYEWLEGDTILGEGQQLNYVFPLGVHTVTLKVSDTLGMSDTDEVVITVQDTTAPVVNAAVFNNSLWPANNKMVDVGFSYQVSDGCAEDVDISIAVTADEPTATAPGAGGPNHAPDAEIAADGRILLRAERSGSGDGRVYRITVTATDVSGNSAFSSVFVRVNHNKKTEAVDSGQLYDATQVN